MEYELIRSKRKTLSLEISEKLNPLVRAPMKMPKALIDDFVEKHEKWIQKQIIKKQQWQAAMPELSEEQIKEFKKNAKLIINQKIESYSNLMQLYPSSVKITSAKKRFGSCSGKNALCFSWRLMLYENAAIDYVVVHELAHIKHHDHSRRFYALIESVLPDYKAREALLKQPKF